MLSIAWLITYAYIDYVQLYTPVDCGSIDLEQMLDLCTQPV